MKRQIYFSFLHRPVNTYQLRGTIGAHLDTLRRLQEWFETAIQVLLTDLELIKEVEDLVIARGGQSSRISVSNVPVCRTMIFHLFHFS